MYRICAKRNHTPFALSPSLPFVLSPSPSSGQAPRSEVEGRSGQAPRQRSRRVSGMSAQILDMSHERLPRSRRGAVGEYDRCGKTKSTQSDQQAGERWMKEA
jgi:hypothetical protein